MSREVVSKIREAEAEAARIRTEATEKAREIVRNAEANGKKFCEKIEREATSENAEKLRLTREKADELLERSRANAEKEAELAREKCAPNMAEAVRLIVGGIKEACQ